MRFAAVVPRALAVSVAAPGVGIVSTWPGGGVETHDGTSLAAPIVRAAPLALRLRERRR